MNGAWIFSVFFAFQPQLSSLPLDLAGVVVDTRAAAQSTCLIQLRPGPKTAGPFRIGDRVFDLAEIKLIGNRGVLVRNILTNREERLAFPKDRPAFSPAPAAPPPPRLSVLAEDKIDAEIPEEAIRYYTGHLEEFLNSALATPRLKNGPDGTKIVEGFEISRIKRGGIVDRLGLQDGDVILAVDGEPLTSIEGVMTFAGRVAAMSRTELTVRRGGRKLILILRRK